MHFSVPISALSLNKAERKRLRKRVYAFKLKLGELEQETPSFEDLKQEVNVAFEHLMKVLENWRDRHLNTLEQCHSTMVEAIKAGLAHAKEAILVEVAEATDDPLEIFFQIEDPDINLLKTEIKECEEALEKAFVLNITSDLSQVQKIICREEVDIPCEKCDKLRLKHETMEKDFAKRLGDITEENEELKQQISESLSELKNVKEESNKFQGEARSLHRQESNLRQKIKTHIENEAIFKHKLEVKDDLIAKLKNQIDLGMTAHFDSHQDKLPAIKKDLSVEDVGDQLPLTTSGRTLNLPKKYYPPTRIGNRTEVKRACVRCHREIEPMQTVCSFCSPRQTDGIFPTEIFTESEEGVEVTPHPAPVTSPRPRLKESSTSHSKKRIRLQPDDSNPWKSKLPPNTEEL